MTVRVRLFAALRDAVGCDSFELAAKDRLDLPAVIDAIRARFGDVAYAAVSAENVRVAVNREFVDGPFHLRDGDEIALMPPVTGG
jgi:MoaE-MoaD fusion protein